MAIEIRQRTCVIPAGTAQAAPVTFDLSFPQRRVDTLELIVPPGPGGYVGFYVANSGVQVIPYDKGEWIVTAQEKISWPLEGFITSGSWQLVGYNTGTNPHAVYVRFLLSLPTDKEVARTVMLDNSDLDSGTQIDTYDLGPGVIM